MATMLGKFYYHALLRKYVAAFGSLFDHIEVVNFATNGDEVSRTVVPISYGPREKYVVKVEQDADLTRPRAILLPRLGFEITTYRYNGQRKQPSLAPLQFNQNSVTAIEPHEKSSIFQPVPYDIGFNLYIVSKSVDTGNQIVEQILPMFTPDYTLVVNTIPSLATKTPVVITLNDVQSSDNYDGDFIERRSILWTLAFTMKAEFYGPVRTAATIGNTVVNVYEKDHLELMDTATELGYV